MSELPSINSNVLSFFAALEKGAAHFKHNYEPASVARLARAAFTKAPEDFLESINEEEMFRITMQMVEFHETFQCSDIPFQVEIRKEGRSPSRSMILTSVCDRPFIIDTLTEFLRRHGITHHVLLHPLIVGKRGVTSVVYIEIDLIEDSTQREILQKQLIQHFECLIAASDDFPELLKRTEAAALLLENEPNNMLVAEKQEAAHFMRWLADGGFIFLGSQEWQVPQGKAVSTAAVVIEDSQLGIFRMQQADIRLGLAEIPDAIAHLQKKEYLLYFSKLLMESPIHRFARIDTIIIALPTTDKQYAKYACFIGLFTSRAKSLDVLSVPVIRKKLKQILDSDGLLPNTYDYKEVIAIAECLPKTEWLRSGIDSLSHDVHLILNIQRRNAVRVSYRMGPLKRFISFLVVAPRSQFSSEIGQKIRDAFEERVGAQQGSSEIRISVTVEPLVIIHLLVPNPSSLKRSFDISELEQEVTELILSWDNKFTRALSQIKVPSEAKKICARYLSVIPRGYKALIPIEEAVQDILMLEQLNEQQPLALALRGELLETGFDLKLYKYGEPYTLTGILPFLENAGLSVISERSSTIAATGHFSTIYILHVIPKTALAVSEQRFNSDVLTDLKMVLLRYAEKDILNHLMLNPGLSIRQIAVVRVLCRYLLQIKASSSERALLRAAINNPSVVATLIEYFETKFSPVGGVAVEADRVPKLDQLKLRYLEQLRKVNLLVEDRALRALLNVVESCVRTNYYQTQDDLRVALKIDCKRIEQMPSPRPLFEIFVNAPDFEGVHLRGGMVARGGLRWSERPEDYRTEILGLIKTQMVKNSIIIPTGAKGGFVVKALPDDASHIAEVVRNCYSRFIESLLLVTDNRVDGHVVPPANTVRYDGDDPYLVVAADKGTAAFSDLANSIAVDKFNFWLGDAFASGGSNGYDHKKLSITARGAWETTCRHFRELGIDIESQGFTVVGIGDMSGDVFGNGLLCSKKAKLIAAFNHRHIFVDPNPDPESSYKERQRLFDLPRSQWSDYDAKSISAGGGIYERSAKEIALSSQAQRVLGIEQEVLSGEALVRAILLAPVDLLWNGGIGTYAKAKSEQHVQVGDRTNDEVRADACDLRVKIVGEGGNLGFTQLARVEFASIGGCINTDAVDNSGGVNLSDVEVNLKILLRAAVDRKEISLQERNQILVSFAEESCDNVIARNSAQSKMLSVERYRSERSLEPYISLLSSLEKEKRLHRAVEFLPDDETLRHLADTKRGLSRPEIAVIAGYTRMWLTDIIVRSNIPEHPLAARFLTDYFPKAIVQKFARDVQKHALRREIISTEIANVIINSVGPCFVHHTSQEGNVSQEQVILAFLSASEILDSNSIRARIIKADAPATAMQFVEVELKLSRELARLSLWILDNATQQALSSGLLVDRYKQQFAELYLATSQQLRVVDLQRFNDLNDHYKARGLTDVLISEMISLSYSVQYLDAAHLAFETNTPVSQVIELHMQLLRMLAIRPLLESAYELETTDRLEAMAIRATLIEIKQAISALTRAIVSNKNQNNGELLESYFRQKHELLRRFQSCCEEVNTRPVTLAVLAVIAKQLEAIAKD